MSYCNDSQGGSPTRECEMGIDPAPWNMFWGFVQDQDLYISECVF